MATANNDILTAEVILKSPSGKAITTEKSVTTANIEQVLPASQQIQETSTLLTHAGFISIPSATTITIRGTAALFESYFKMQLKMKQHKRGAYAVASKKPQIPPILKKTVQDIIFGEPQESFY